MDAVDVEREGRWTRPALALAWLAAALLIVAAARGDLWLDEIWSLSFARQARSALDVLARFHHDNNHPLNTLYLYVVGPRAPLVAYRLLAVASGVASVALAGAIAARGRGPPEALAAVILVGSSYPLVLYFSEARGYAPAIFFALAASLVLQGILEDAPRTMSPGPGGRLPAGRAVLFWAASALGALSSFTFVTVSLAFAGWHLAHEAFADGPPRRRAVRFLSLQLPPFAFLAWLYAYFMSDMTFGAGPVYATGVVVARAAALLLGLPLGGAWPALALVVVLLIVVAGVVRLRTDGDESWLFFIAVLVFAPALVLALVRPRYLYVRYFVVCFPFFLLLLARLLGAGFRSEEARWRRAAVGAVTILVALQAPRVTRLVELGRGGYTAALEQVIASSPGGVIRIGGDNDFRNRMVVEFYASRLAGGERLHYVERPDRSTTPPEWMLAHSQDPGYRPPATLILPEAGDYALAGQYPFSGISGWGWFLYRRTGQ